MISDLCGKVWVKMTIDERISCIMKKAEGLSNKHPQFSCGEFPPKWKPPLSEEAVAAYEEKNGIRLPEDYKRFITTTASAGTQPFYGLYGLPADSSVCEDGDADVKKPFLFTVRSPLRIEELSEEEYDRLFEGEGADTGYLFLCHEGCGMYSILIINSEDQETYGTVWYYDLANDAGIFPLLHPDSQSPMNFLDWLEYYVDRTLELDDRSYFSYGELAGVVTGDSQE